VFSAVFRELGYTEGFSIDVQLRFAEGDAGRYPEVAEELVRLNPDVIVVDATQATVACKRATATIPIVSSLTDPVGQGLITSLARPGGNVTGILTSLEGLSGKQLQLLAEAIPGLSRVGLIISANQRPTALHQQAYDTAEATMGITLVPVEVRTRDDFDKAFQALTQARVEAVLASPNILTMNFRSDSAALAIAARLPVMGGDPRQVEAGFLIVYGFDLRQSYRRAAYFVDRILKGVKPSDLPGEIPTNIGLYLNLKTAKALDITIPPSMMILANGLIE
jgi:putative ABC transport system substrate-binding protein